MKTSIIKNNNDWFLVSVRMILRFSSPFTRFFFGGMHRVWINTYLVHAESMYEAANRGMNLGLGEEQTGCAPSFLGFKREWKCLGVSECLPVYENIEDGAEMFWTDMGIHFGR